MYLAIDWLEQEVQEAHVAIQKEIEPGGNYANQPDACRQYPILCQISIKEHENFPPTHARAWP